MKGKTGDEKELFNSVLYSAKKALDNIGVQFHLHAGTALGAHREKNFIKHDHDIDLAVFYDDINTPRKVNKVITAMKDSGFDIVNKLGRLNTGQEIQFVKDDIPLDIFWIYRGKYRGENLYITSSYFGMCNDLPRERCIWGYSTYDVKKITFLGHRYNVVPKKTLVEMYGKDWKFPKVYNYFDGLTQGHSKGLIADYYKPVDINKKVAYCFMIYDRTKHPKIWEDFFSQDLGPIKLYNLYAHIKTVNDETQKWLATNKIRTIKTGWCEENLVWVWVNMLKEAYKDKTNQYFCLLSGDCIPLYKYWDTYKKIVRVKKSRLNITRDHDIYDTQGMYYSDQWMILDRQGAKAMIDLKDSDSGKKFIKSIKGKMSFTYDDGYTYTFCPDEIYPSNWLIHKWGALNSQKFKSKVKSIVTTWTHWNNGPHPIKYNLDMIKRHKSMIAKTDAIFARKFNKGAAKYIAMNL